ncbi:hypothetical protein ACFFRR_010107 [Megaselia abdita]
MKRRHRFNLHYKMSLGRSNLFSVTILVILGVVATQISFSSQKCPSSRNSRIVGGSEADRHEMPFIVSLTRRGGHFCGATILNEQWLLTAGHCLCNGLNQFMKPHHITGIVGLHSISEYQTNKFTGHIIEVEFQKIEVHQGYSCTKIQDDIALLKMSKPLLLGLTIKPICLTTNNLLENSLAVVSGWGWTNEDLSEGIRSDKLRKASVSIWSNKECERSFHENGRTDYNIKDTQMCAGFKNGGVDSCWADSGGPLVSDNNFLVGVVSTGIGCARPGLPGIYTRVSNYIDWISSVVNS